MTTKLGSSDKRPGTGAHDIRQCKLYAGEAAMSMFVLSAAIYGIVTVNRWTFSVFLMLQGMRPCCAVQLVPHLKNMCFLVHFTQQRFCFGGRFLFGLTRWMNQIRQMLLHTLQMWLLEHCSMRFMNSAFQQCGMLSACTCGLHFQDSLI